ncbi:GTP-binding protein [Clostridium ljungdahlii]|uniref:Putative metal chaperone YciC n=1 Tax=Clostridium ljungdahlii TaxID=1538 RepID=A0A166RZH0_9CLOT|nr:GTP-binding protein [Clostridium ljungdahlii]OAA91393.1 putative metal chaperone YciC [Clostridium ljungdahlii]
MSKPNLIIIGGFLGAGKTTSILNLTKLLQETKNVGVITNDQGTQLVDTSFLSKEGINVMEVTGGCFCCNFDSFSKRIDQMIEKNNPDIIIGEPVGSCTDLIATIYRPMNNYFANKFTLAPLSVVVDPKKVMQFLGSKAQSLYPDEVKYLFRKQIEEADIIVLNKIDLMSQQELVTVENIIKKNFPEKELVEISAKENINMDLWLEKIEKTKHKDNFTMDVNYQTYGRAEAYLGWLNTSAELFSSEVFDISAFIREFMEVLKSKFNNEKLEIAHLKIYGVSNNKYVKAGLTGLSDDINFNGQILLIAGKANIIINARINVNPESLEDYVISALNNFSAKKDITLKNIKTECFMPGQPNPKYRMSSEDAKKSLLTRRNKLWNL